MHLLQIEANIIQDALVEAALLNIQIVKADASIFLVHQVDDLRVVFLVHVPPVFLL